MDILCQTKLYVINQVNISASWIVEIGCYYDHSVFTPFKPVRFELLGRTEDEYKCNRGKNVLEKTEDKEWQNNKEILKLL